MIGCFISMFGHVINSCIGVSAEIGRIGGNGDGRPLFPGPYFGFGECGSLQGLRGATGWSKDSLVGWFLGGGECSRRQKSGIGEET